MKRAVMVVLLCMLAAGVFACATHSDRWLGEESTTAVSHVPGCGMTLMMAALAAVLPFLPLMGGLAPQHGPLRLLRRPISFFRPPEHLS